MNHQQRLRMATAGLRHSVSQGIVVPLLLLGIWSSGLGWPGRSLAESQPPVLQANNSLPSEPPLDLNAFKPGQAPAGVVTANTISPTHLTIPSLWWAQEQIVALMEALNRQFGRELMINWLAYPIEQGQAGRVDLMVDRQYWGALDYLQRYEFVNRFSATARSYGYNVRVFDQQGTIVAAFICDFSRADLRLLQLSTELPGIPLLRLESGYSRSPIVDQRSCTTAVETGTSSFLRRNLTPFK